MSRLVASVGSKCVSCGTCVKVCPKKAITIFKGMYASIDSSLCVGCGKCEKICPAGIITMIKREEL